MADIDARALPQDPHSTAALAEAGLEYRLIPANGDGFPHFLQAVNRGFLGEESTPEQVEASRVTMGFRRMTGIFDRTGLQPLGPVATVDSWITQLTLPGRQTIPMWAISGVTVSPTHRRKGIARAMLEGELRTAAAAGIPIAGLTVSEATIYHRFGFSPATYATDWSIETKRARWIGPRPDGRLDFLDREALPDELSALHERVRNARPGEVAGWPGLWQRQAGTTPGAEGGRKVRAVRYADASGITRGIAVYRITEHDADFTKNTLNLQQLITETPDAYAALWRFLLEHDLVETVKAPLRSVDEPLRWMISDQRGASVTTSDHGWLRILDVVTTLQARRYSASGTFVLRVEDALGFADGTWRIDIDAAGAATVTATDAAPDLSMTVNELGSILLGGVRAVTLFAAGSVHGDRDAATALDASFASADTPYLGLWY